MLFLGQSTRAQTPTLPSERPEKIEPTNYGFDYVRREVYRSPDLSNPYGMRTNWGEKVLVKLDPGCYMVLNVPTGEYEDFVTGFVTGDNEVWGRSVDATVARDVALLVSEDGNGTIWRISR